jgi:hypothetical protein
MNYAVFVRFVRHLKAVNAKGAQFSSQSYLWLNILASKTINMLFAKNYQSING